MIATSFDEENCVLSKPEDMSVDQCTCLSVFQGDSQDGIPLIISCWKPTKEELKEINKTGRVWLTVLGKTMAPVIMSGISPWKE